MTRYSKGAKFENEVIKHYRDMGMLCLRSAGSKTPIDVIAISEILGKPVVYLIQCKYGNAKMSKKDIIILKKLAWKYGSIGMYAFRNKYEKRINFIQLN